MARKIKIQEEPDILPSVSPEIGVKLLMKQISKAKELLATELDDRSDHTPWSNTTREYLVKIFGSKSPNINAVIHAHSSVSMHMNMAEYEMKEYRQSLIENQIKMLESCIEQLNTEIELQSTDSVKSEIIKDTTISNDVFIVHGHNESMREMVVSLISKLELNPIVLHELPNLGRTLIEKFTEHSDVGFAVVILTPDDLGKARQDAELKDRARQNVIFELGYFIGWLGRERVCALYEQGVELPSDYQGIAYVPIDTAGKWRFDIARELKAAGYGVDANKLF